MNTAKYEVTLVGTIELPTAKDLEEELSQTFILCEVKEIESGEFRFVKHRKNTASDGTQEAVEE